MMYLLPCPNCQASLPVTPAQAGDSLPCPSCEASVAVPKLGELRRLPQQDEPTGSQTGQVTKAVRGGEAGVGSRIAFAILGLIAIPAFLAAGYSGIRWAALESPVSTEEHLDRVKEAIEKAPPATMIREFEDMEEFSLDITAPYGYKRKENEKTKWGRATLVTGLVGLVCVIGAISAAASTGSKRRSA